jgi:hypothetical protein
MARTAIASWVALVLSAFLSAPALASHTVFSGSCDRFEIDGNVFGPADGTPDQVDDFDDGVLGPNWATLVGTVTESGGFLTAHNPGLDIDFFPGVTLDVSNAENTTDVENGAGDFTATSYWTTTLPDVNRGYHFQLYGIGAGVEAAGITVDDSDGTIGSPQGAFVGYTINQSVTFVLGASGVPQSDTVQIQASDVTGPLVLRMAFDDANDTLTCSFSLDGGVTFQSPFPPLHVFQVVDQAEILIGASSVTANLPPPPSCGASFLSPHLVLKRLRQPIGEQGLTFKTRVGIPFNFPGGFRPSIDGLSFLVDDVPVPVALRAPAGGLGSGCDPRDGWTTASNGSRYEYRNYSNALPPDCTPGSAAGLTKVKYLDRRVRRNEVRLSFVANETAIYDDNNFQLRARLELGPGPNLPDGDCAESTLVCRGEGGGTIKRCP